MKYVDNKIVYEDGDWCWSLFDDRVYKITEGGSYEKRELSAEYCNRSPNNRRPATQEEINKALKNEPIMVGEYIVDFSSAYTTKEIIRIGCVRVSKELFLKIGKKAKWID